MIPDFNHMGVLPPFLGENPTSSNSVSPYTTTVLDICKQLATSKERVVILKGWLEYRQVLLKANFQQGFQWLDGSFLENVESIRNRAPADLDLVTFINIEPTEIEGFIKQYQNLLDSTQCKRDYFCDAYIVNLKSPAEILVDDVRYWFGLFSHQRDTLVWKGMLQVRLSCNDSEALEYLSNLSL